MAEQRDMIDEIIDFQDDWRALQNPFGGMMDTLTADPSKQKVWNPGDYKERPRGNAILCLRTSSEVPEACDRCLQACPVDAIKIDGKRVEVTDACIKCGLCTAACPTGVFLSQKLTDRNLYDRVARVAGAYEQCYVTCTRAIGKLGRLPMANEVVLPCVGALCKEIWFSLLADYDNVSVYLPLGICDRCKTQTGEESYAEHIAQAEEWSGGGVGLEVDADAMTHDLTRAYKRSQFISNMARTGAQMALAATPVLSGAKVVAQRIKQHNDQLLAMQRELEKVVGAKSDQNQRRVLTQHRKQLLTTLQHHPRLAEGMEFLVPTCDWSRCTMCGDCSKTCSLHACSLDANGRFSVEVTYCINCGACAIVCPEDALTMEPCDPHELVIPDPEAEKLAERRAELAKKKEEARAKLNRGLDALESLADAE